MSLSLYSSSIVSVVLDILYLMPVEEALNIIDFESKQQTQIINAQSTTNAQGWSGLLNSFSEKSKLTYTDFLPYRDSDKKLKLNDDFNQPSEATIKALSLLIQQKRLPRKIINALANVGLLQQITNVK